MLRFYFIITFIFLFFIFSAKLLKAEQSDILNKSISLTVLDVGYADSIFFSSQKENFLIDAGSDKKLSFEKFFNKNQIKNLNFVILTHPHKNHFNSLVNILDQVKINKFYINGDNQVDSGYNKLLEKAKKLKISIEIVKAGRTIPVKTPNLELKILSPLDLNGDPNENSIASWIRYKKTTALLLSDLLPKQQEQILHNYPDTLNATLIQVAHHGDFLINEFIKTSNDKLYFVSTGLNKYGSPNENLLRSLGSRVFRTDQFGEVKFTTYGERWVQN
jgi:beta-lactamase superfamily II metal-dependent hydrolase